MTLEIFAHNPEFLYKLQWKALSNYTKHLHKLLPLLAKIPMQKHTQQRLNEEIIWWMRNLPIIFPKLFLLLLCFFCLSLEWLEVEDSPIGSVALQNIKKGHHIKISFTQLDFFPPTTRPIQNFGLDDNYELHHE